MDYFGTKLSLPSKMTNFGPRRMMLPKAQVNGSPFPDLNGLSENLPHSDSVNILILGETGVGKSTFVNAFANYLAYPDMDSAENAELISLIPTSFNVTDDNFKSVTVSSGKDSNEDAKPGASQTQSCRAYLIKTAGQEIRLIDSPGIGDTRGIEQDRKNFENILAFLAQYPVLHGICILLKPNHARLSVVFRFCIQELLCHLHKSAVENIMFVFTNTRSTFYRPGDTMVPLQELLKEVTTKDPQIVINLNKDRIFCVDNEGFRFVVAVKNGIPFADDEKDNFSKSWEKSAVEYWRVVDRAAGSRAHLVQDTISVNEARNVILALAKPIGDITQNIQTNLSMLSDQDKKIAAAGNDIAKLKKELYVPVVDLEPVKYDQPRTVCTSKGCVEVFTVDGVKKIDYKTLCHRPCYLQNVEKDVVNNSDLKHCTAMNSSYTCNVCGCGWDKHMHVYYENKQVKVNKKSDATDKMLKDKEQRNAKIQQVSNEIRDRQNQLQKEQNIIIKISAEFANFLKKNAITPFNDAVKDYLEHLIENEKTKCQSGYDCKDVLDGLKRMCREYEAEVKILESSLSSRAVSSQQTLSPANMSKRFQELYSLPINGPAIKKILDQLLVCKNKAHSNAREKVYDFSNYSRR